MPSEYAIETDSLQKVYRSRWSGREIRAVSGVTLRVPRGIKYGLLGANGAGKTTLVKMLLSAVHPTAGTATLFGVDAQLPEARRPVGYLPENHRFPTYLTGEGMLDFYAALSGVEVPVRRERVPELLELVGLRDWGTVRIKKYSKGMLQRLGLAQALLHRPDLLILDEPTDGVDPVGRRDIRDVLNRLTGTGVTIFINSHLLSEVEAFCDYVAILKQGRLALEGTVSELTTGNAFRVEVTSITAVAAQELRPFATSFEHLADAYVFQATTLDSANALIDRIRATGGMIRSVTARASSLEDIFIETTRPTKESAA